MICWDLTACDDHCSNYLCQSLRRHSSGWKIRSRFSHGRTHNTVINSLVQTVLLCLATRLKQDACSCGATLAYYRSRSEISVLQVSGVIRPCDLGDAGVVIKAVVLLPQISCPIYCCWVDAKCLGDALCWVDCDLVQAF